MVGAITHSEAYLKERSYRVAEALRHKNQREQRRLEIIIGERNGLEAKHRHEISAVNKQEDQIKRELARTKQTSSTTGGILPARNPDSAAVVHHSRRRGSRRHSRQDVRVRNEADQKSTEDRLRRFNESYPLASPTRSHNGSDGANAQSPSRETPAVGKHNVDNAREAIIRRLTVPHVRTDDVGVTPRVPGMLPPLDESRSDPAVAGAIVAKQKRSTGSTQPAEDVNSQATDAVQATHNLPDLEKSLKEVRKTRYVRHKKKQWFETELTLNEIFHPNLPET